jgi:hypothetical protein
VFCPVFSYGRSGRYLTLSLPDLSINAVICAIAIKMPNAKLKKYGHIISDSYTVSATFLGSEGQP